MRFPLSMTAGMAGYIAKNKMRPRPEWQKRVVAKQESANPFRIVHSSVSAGRVRAPISATSARNTSSLDLK